jgi:protein DGCR14
LGPPGQDEYTATLEAIIERDFFPELAKLQSKVAWLQAIRSGDPEQIRQAQLLIAQRRAAAAGGRPATGATPRGAPLFTPGGTAARAIAGNTPYIPPLPPGEPLRQPRPATGGGGGAGDAVGEAEELGVVAPPPVSLDSFLAVHTSEDNASFQEILETVNKKRRCVRAVSHSLVAVVPAHPLRNEAPFYPPLRTSVSPCPCISFAGVTSCPCKHPCRAG